MHTKEKMVCMLFPSDVLKTKIFKGGCQNTDGLCHFSDKVLNSSSERSEDELLSIAKNL